MSINEKRRHSLSKKKKRLILIIVAVVLLFLAAGYTVFIAPLLKKDKWVYKEETVERGTLKIGVTESGSLDYGVTSIQYDLDLDVSDDDDDDDDDEEETTQKYLKIEEVYVKNGQRINEGDALVKFTQDSVDDVRMLLQSAAADAQSDYATALSEYNLSALEAKTNYESRKLEAQYASSIYNNSLKSVENDVTSIQVEINQRTANIATLEQNIADAQENYDTAWTNFKDVPKPTLAENDNVVNFLTMQKTYLSLQTAYERAKTSLESAKQALTDNANQITSLQSQLSAANAKKSIGKIDAEATYQESSITGDNTQITYDAEIESLKETLQEAEDKKDEVQKQLEDFEAFVGTDGCLYADGTGIVTEVDYEAGDRLQNVGTMVAYAAPSDMTISVDVTQEDIVDLKVSDKVDITFLAYEDTSYEGHIKSINTTATSSGSNTVSYSVVIAVEGDTSLLYGGMTADIIFVKEQKDDVLLVSKKAIVKENGKSYVYVKSALGKMELKEVEVGADNGVSIEIVSGLNEGDVIYLASKVSNEADVMSQEQTSQDSNSGSSDSGFHMPDGFDGSNMPDFGSGNMPDFGSGNMPDFGGAGGGFPGGQRGGSSDGGRP